jgi:hypothetical protein
MDWKKWLKPDELEALAKIEAQHAEGMIMRKRLWDRARKRRQKAERDGLST